MQVAPVATCFAAVIRYPSGGLNKPIQATRLRNTLRAARAPVIAHTCQTQALLVPTADLTSAPPLPPSSESNVPLPESRGVKCFSRKRFSKAQSREVGGGGFDGRRGGNKSTKSSILPLQRLCSCCHNKGLIGNNISTQGKNGSHLQLCNTQRNYSEAAHACVCVC